MANKPKPSSRAPGIGSQMGANFTLNTVLQVAGFLPSFAHTQLQQDVGAVFVLRGRNFDWDLRGPRSGYGNARLSADALPLPLIDQSVKFFRIREQTYLFAAGKVLTLAADCTRFNEVFNFRWGYRECRECDAYHAWSMAYVGKYYLFSHPMCGIIFYDEHRQEWGEHPLDAPCFDSCIYGICRAANRLCILTQDTVVTSKYDDPFAMECNGYYGAGIQSLDEISGGLSYGIYETKTGFVAYTSRGAMVGTEINQVFSSIQMTADPGDHSAGKVFIPLPGFRVDIETTDLVPLSSHCIVEVSGQVHLILSKRGFFMIDGKRGHNELTNDQQWQSMVGQYIAEQELITGDDGECARIRLEYDWQHGKLFVGFRDLPTRPYFRTLVYQFDFDKWGSFDYEYWAIGPVHMERVQFNRKKSLGWLTSTGYIVEINRGAYSQVADDRLLDRVVGEKCHPFNYALDSFIEIGPFRRTDFTYHDRFSSFVNVALTVPHAHGAEGLRTPATGGEVDAWEERASLDVPSRFEAEIACSIDATRLFEDNREPLHLVAVDGKVRHYSCYNTGVSANVILRAGRVGDYYQLNTIHVTAHNAGRY